MSNSNKAQKAETVATAPAVRKAEISFPLEVLRKDSVKLFGVTSSTFDGAMSGQTGPLTVARAKEIIETWKKGVAK